MSGSQEVEMSYDTLTEMIRFVRRNYNYPKHFNSRCRGSWRSWSTEEFFREVEELTAGLYQIGVRKDDKVALVGPPSAEWAMADFAIVCAGATTVPMFDKMAAESFRFQIKDAEVTRMFVVGDDALKFAHAHCDLLKTIIALRCSERLPASVMTGDQLRERGHTAPDGLFQQLSHQAGPRDLATIVYTSGSTGMPKGVELSHRALATQIGDLLKLFPMCDQGKDRMLVSLPMAHVFSRHVAYSGVAGGAMLYWTDDITQLAEAAREIRPTMTTAVPRLLEKIYLKMRDEVTKRGGLAAKLGLFAINEARKPHLTGWRKTILKPILDRVIYSKLRGALGGCLHPVGSGAAPLDPKLEAFFCNIGVPIYHGYGSSEGSSGMTVNCPDAMRPGTVGIHFPSYEVKIAADGEVLARGPCLMNGYHKRPDLTAKVIDSEGWYHTGDLGTIDAQGFLVITGRIKEIMKTSGGKIVSPVPVEQALSHAALVDMALVVAEGRKCVGALLVPDRLELERFKQRHDMVSLKDNEVFNTPLFKAETQRILDQVNAPLSEWQRVRKVCWIMDPLTIESGDLTPTMKIRRTVVEKKYSDQIDAMFS